eukprot:4147505-Amphidinium_carterae.1
MDLSDPLMERCEACVLCAAWGERMEPRAKHLGIGCNLQDGHEVCCWGLTTRCRLKVCSKPGAWKVTYSGPFR